MNRIRILVSRLSLAFFIFAFVACEKSISNEAQQSETTPQKPEVIQKVVEEAKEVVEEVKEDVKEKIEEAAEIVEEVEEQVEIVNSQEEAAAEVISEIVETQSPAKASPFQEKIKDVTDGKELVTFAWEASGKSDLAGVDHIVGKINSLFEEEAKKQNSSLTKFPPPDKVDNYGALNSVATGLFIQGEAYMHQGRTDDAIATFKKNIDEFSFGQAWDPSRGSYWSTAEKSQASIDKLTGKEEEEVVEEELETLPNIVEKGTEKFIDYTKYGKFIDVETENYRYEVFDPSGLTKAVGEGIYPNTGAVLRNPGYKKALKEGRLKKGHWDYVRTSDLEAAYYKWATAPEPWGVKLFYLGLIYEAAGMWDQALKAYHALLVHFPNAVGWTYWQTPWYPGQAAIAKIKHIVREHPELNLRYKWGRIVISNGFDNDISNDTFEVHPGVLEERKKIDDVKEMFGMDGAKEDLGKEVRKIGEGRVQLVQYENEHWQMLVDGKPFLIKGITYAPTKVGQSPDQGTLGNWMEEDFNKNGNIDGPYDSFVDANGNNKQDPDEPTVGDFQLMKDMGVNVLRIYHQPDKPVKEVLQAMHRDYGIMVIMGDFLGKYTLGSGAKWSDGTDYENEEHRKNMMASVKEMVMEHKDEPYMLMWLLGNENNYGVASNADKKPQAYFQFANEVSKMIKELDKDHPVSLCNGDTLFLDVFAQNAPDIDIFSANVYRGDYGFGAFWQQVQGATGKPAYITEYGAPAYASKMTEEEAESAQAAYHRGNWLDIYENSAGYSGGVGNSLGGVVFEWLDEWWKNYEPALHDKKSDVIGPFPGGYYYEEWFGLVSQGDGKLSPYLRKPRKVYYTYKELWN